MERHKSIIVAFICLALAFTAGARADWGGGAAPGVQAVNGCTGTCNFPANLGSKTLAQLATIPCDNSTTLYGSIAYVTDLGGGANNVKCINGTWRHFTLGTPAQNSSTTTQTITWTPLSSAPIIQLTGIVATLNTITLQIQTTNLYPEYEACVIAPPSLLGLINLTVSGTGLNISIGAGTHNCYVWNGTALVQVSS